MDEGTPLTLRSGSGSVRATVAALPFFDPAKQVPVS
jgi:hypothetical protein